MIILLLTIIKFLLKWYHWQNWPLSLKVVKSPLFYKNWLVFLYLLYFLLEKQPYLVSTSFYQLSVKSILLLTYVWFYWCLQKLCETKWQVVTKYYATVILNNMTMWGLLLQKEWVLLCITYLLYQKKASFTSFHFVYTVFFGMRLAHSL